MRCELCNDVKDNAIGDPEESRELGAQMIADGAELTDVFGGDVSALNEVIDWALTNAGDECHCGRLMADD